ncbi:hypothetical protein Ciccas_001591 [Cichlidogyrus casuarinus]|uniref:ELP1 N-terminal second beta-propeller domain-containing protein n=1 Tax=Cichlidogyrus casuarinus TaxID=1844966 RepID=A0ABD2QLW8_9PLAT
MIVKSRLRKSGEIDLCFFELCGQRHRYFQFLSPSQQATKYHVDKIKFDKLGTLLAVSCLPNDSSGLIFVRILTCSNYHWSVKWQYSADSSIQTLPFAWNYNCLMGHNTHILNIYDSQKSTFEIFEFDSSVYSVCQVHSKPGAKDSSLAIVVDTNDLKISDFGRALIPPPMCSTRIKFRKTQDNFLEPCINFVSMPQCLSFQSADSIPVLVQVDAQLVLLSLDPNGPVSHDSLDWQEHSLGSDLLLNHSHECGPKGKFPFAKTTTLLTLENCRLDTSISREEFQKMQIEPLLHCTWFEDNRLALIINEGRSVILMQLHFPLINIRKIAEFQADCDDRIVGTCAWNDCILLQKCTGDVIAVPVATREDVVDLNNTNFAAGRIPCLCHQMRVVDILLAGNIRQSVLLAYSSSQAKLYALPLLANYSGTAKLIMDFCTSVNVHKEFLLVSSFNHELRCFRLLQNNLILDSKPEALTDR